MRRRPHQAYIPRDLVDPDHIVVLEGVERPQHVVDLAVSLLVRSDGTPSGVCSTYASHTSDPCASVIHVAKYGTVFRAVRR